MQARQWRIQEFAKSGARAIVNMQNEYNRHDKYLL